MIYSVFKRLSSHEKTINESLEIFAEFCCAYWEVYIVGIAKILPSQATKSIFGSMGNLSLFFFFFFFFFLVGGTNRRMIEIIGVWR